MPTTVRTHLDMLQLCCGICGKKKNPKLLRPISESVLIQIKSIDGYQAYDLNDNRYPKVICEQHRGAICERVKNPSLTAYKFNLPSDIPQFNTITLPHAATRATPSGFNEAHTCFLCEQNIIGRPKKHDENHNKPYKVCPKCLQITGWGISHSCVKSTKKSVVGITNVIQELKPHVQDQVCYSLLKSKVDTNSNSVSKSIKLHRSGRPTKIEMNPSNSSDWPSICTET